MERYFKAYSTIAQNPDATHQMYEFFSPEVKVYSYVTPLFTFDGEKFLKVSSSHPHVQETLRPKHLIIDERQKMVAALLGAELIKKATEEVIQITFAAHYQLILDENNTIKIKELWIFAEPLPPGKPSIVELFRKIP